MSLLLYEQLHKSISGVAFHQMAQDLIGVICFQEDGIQKQSKALAFIRSGDWELFLGDGTDPCKQGIATAAVCSIRISCVAFFCAWFGSCLLGYFGFSLRADF